MVLLLIGQKRFRSPSHKELFLTRWHAGRFDLPPDPYRNGAAVICIDARHAIRKERGSAEDRTEPGATQRAHRKHRAFAVHALLLRPCSKSVHA
jgi:hypothetical protein